MNEFEINGVRYRSGRLNAMQQFHVARRLVPVMAAAAGAQGSMAAVLGKADALDIPVDRMAAVMRPIADALSNLPDADCEYVFDKCLGTVQRSNDGGKTWSPVWNARAGRLMFDDVDLPAMLQITMEVIKDNISGFSLAPALTSRGPGA